MGKNIVLCCDGTNNAVTSHSTNVLRLYRAATRNDSQLTYYDGGVGTLVDPTVMSRCRKWLRKHLDSAIAYGFKTRPRWKACGLRQIACRSRVTIWADQGWVCGDSMGS